MGKWLSGLVFSLVLMGTLGCNPPDRLYHNVRLLDTSQSTVFARSAILALANGQRSWLLQFSREPATTKLSDDATFDQILSGLSLTESTRVSLRTVGYDPLSRDGYSSFFGVDVIVRLVDETRHSILGDIVLRCQLNTVSGVYSGCTLKDWSPRSQGN